MPNKLATLARLRKLQADLARAELGTALRAEAAAEAALAAARQAPSLERAHATNHLDHLSAAFANWLPAAVAAIARHAMAAETAAALRVQAAEEAAARKGALEAVEKLTAARQDTARRQALRKVQHALDAHKAKKGSLLF